MFRLVGVNEDVDHLFRIGLFEIPIGFFEFIGLLRGKYREKLLNQKDFSLPVRLYEFLRTQPFTCAKKLQNGSRKDTLIVSSRLYDAFMRYLP